MGHTVARVGPYAIGSVQAIVVGADGQMMAGGDPRRMGYAVGY
jgi:gamma-glutamyltranspeptidase/glutathione hydrolase